jgi:puromycin-sensitive aminopeptidase
VPKEPATTSVDAHRLPRTVTPSHYDLSLEPDLDAATFSGQVLITVEVHEPVIEIVLNAIELEIDEAELFADGSKTPFVATVSYDEDTERATLHFEETLPAGQGELSLAFRGILNDKLHGFYRSTFPDDDGVKHTLAVTQFEATDARRAFPCWDEPDLKAVFKVSLVVEDGLLAISNSAETATEVLESGKRRHAFAETIPMSTYLVAFVVGPLEATEAVDAGGTPLRIVHPIGRGHLAAFALEVGTFCLDYFTDWYGIPYPGDKLDLVAVPDFAFGAMENLGCVTFREVLLLADPEAVTQPELQNVVDVIAHELAHMWFGDLVTMGWWNGIWLNEAFATFAEMKATDAFRPQWDRWVSFCLSRTAAFDVDSLASTRPIEFEVVSPTDAEGMFDILTYEKGAAVVRMLEQYLGEERFRDGIRLYLDRHRLGNTETTDLWDAIEEATGEPVRRIMDSWIFQGGYPLVTAEDAGTGAVRLSQSRFRYLDDSGLAPPSVGGDGSDLPADEPATPWGVPVIAAWRAEDGTEREERRILLDEEPATIETGSAAAWGLVNAGGHGFYRVRHHAQGLAALLEHADELAPIERYALVDDLWAAVLAGEASTLDVLALLPRFAGETDLSVWQRLISAAGALDRLVDGAARTALQALVHELVGDAAERLGPEPSADEDDRTRELRGDLFVALGTLGADQAVVERADELHARYDAEPTSVDPALVSSAVAVLAVHADAARHADFLRRFRNAASPQEERRYLYALAQADHPGVFHSTFGLTLDGTVRPGDAPYVLGRMLMHRDNGGDAWQFVSDRWDELVERFPSNSVARMLTGVRSLDTRPLAESVHEFVASHEIPHGGKQIVQHLEKQRVNLSLREREVARLTGRLTAP